MQGFNVHLCECFHSVWMWCVSIIVTSFSLLSCNQKIKSSTLSLDSVWESWVEHISRSPLIVHSDQSPCVSYPSCYNGENCEKHSSTVLSWESARQNPCDRRKTFEGWVQKSDNVWPRQSTSILTYDMLTLEWPRTTVTPWAIFVWAS